jgi:hypothetical protein
MARAFHFLLRQGSAIPDLAVLQATVKAVGLVACRRLEKGKESRHVVAVAGFFAARSSPGSDRSFSVGLSDSLTGLVTADLVIAFDLVAAAGPVPVVAAGPVVAVVVVVVLFLFVAGSVCSVCPAYSVRSFAAVTGKGRADFVSYSLVLRFSFLRNRNCLSPLYFEDRA